jgi:Cdc6-like AAA superfamily ATPase
MNSRIKSNLKRLVFAPYDHAQVKEILLNRLGALELEIFKKQTVEFLARKASTVAGDVRAALKICQRFVKLPVY